MALTINTNIKNDADGHLIDAKNVKGGFVVVEDFDDLATIPSACKVEGTLAYVQDISSGDIGDTHYWKYTGNEATGRNGFESISIETETVEINIGNSFDITQTYTFTIDAESFGKIALNGSRLALTINNQPLAMFYPDVFVASNNIFQANSILFYDNKQYLANLTVTGSPWTDNATLSFQELQAGSGGGGTGITKKWYEFKFSNTYTDLESALILKIDETQFSQFLNLVNQGGPSLDPNWQNITTKEEFITFYNSIKANIPLSTDLQSSITQMMVVLGAMAYKNGNIPYLGHDKIISTMTDGYTNNRLIIDSGLLSYYDNTTHALKSAFDFNSEQQDYWSISLNGDSTLTITETVESTGGGSGAGSGSGKLYELEMQYTRYYNGNVIKWGSGYRDVIPLSQTVSDDYVTIKVQFYENRFEYMKEVLNPLITTFNTAYQTNISQISQPSDLVSLLNDNLTQSGLGKAMLAYISQLADKTLTNVPFQQGMKLSYTINNFDVSGSFSGSLENNKNFFFDDQYEVESNQISDCAFSINDTCVLHEYGTSGSGSGGEGTAQTKTIYEFTISDNQSSPATIHFSLDEESFNEAVVEINTYYNAVATQMSQSYTNITDVASLKTMFDTYTANDKSGALIPGLNFLLIKSQEKGYMPYIDSYDIDYKRTYNIIDYLKPQQVSNNFITGDVRSFYNPNNLNVNTVDSSVNIQELSKPWFSMGRMGEVNFDVTGFFTNSTSQTMTYTTRQESAGSGSGGGETATKKWYKFVFKEAFDETITIGSDAVQSCKLSIKINEAQFNELCQSLSQGGLTVSTPQDFMDGYEQAKGTQGATGLIYLIVSELVKYAMENQSQCELAFALSDSLSSAGEGDGSVFYPSRNINGFGGKIATSIGGTEYNWLDYITGSANSSLTVTEETETISGGSSTPSEPTLPERFSIAQNLVVNMNGQQYKPNQASWSGSNNDNIRQFKVGSSVATLTDIQALLSHLTGNPTYDVYNATKPTPCFVFCTESNICWKLQYDGETNGLRAYKVVNFPFVVKENRYYWHIMSSNDNRLTFWMNESAMQYLINAINTLMPTANPSWVNITDYNGVADLFNTLKVNASDPATFVLITTLLGSGGYVIKDHTSYGEKTPIYFTKNDNGYAEIREVTGVRVESSSNMMTYVDPFGVLGNSIITNDSSQASDGIYIDSNTALIISKQR